MNPFCHYFLVWQMSIFLEFVLFKTHLSLYCFANGQISTSLKLLYRARYLMVLICGEDHPEVALIDVIIYKKSEYSGWCL